MSWECETCGDSHPGRFSYCPVSGDPRPREQVASRYYYATFHQRSGPSAPGFYGELLHRHPLAQVAEMRQQEEDRRQESVRRLSSSRLGRAVGSVGGHSYFPLPHPEVLFWSELTVREAIVAAKALGMPGLPSDDGLVPFHEITEASRGS